MMGSSREKIPHLPCLLVGTTLRHVLYCLPGLNSRIKTPCPQGQSAHECILYWLFSLPLVEFSEVTSQTNYILEHTSGGTPTKIPVSQRLWGFSEPFCDLASIRLPKQILLKSPSPILNFFFQFIEPAILVMMLLSFLIALPIPTYFSGLRKNVISSGKSSLLKYPQHQGQVSLLVFRCFPIMALTGPRNSQFVSTFPPNHVAS